MKSQRRDPTIRRPQGRGRSWTRRHPWLARIALGLTAVVAVLVVILLVMFVRDRRTVRAMADARKRAQALLPAGVTVEEEAHEGGSFIFSAMDDAAGRHHEVRINEDRPAEMTYRIWAVDGHASSEVVLHNDEVEAVILKDFPEATIVQLRLAEHLHDPGRYYYKVQFTSGGMRGEYTINPETGDPLEIILRYSDPVVLMPVSGEDRRELEASLQDLLETESHEGRTFLDLDEVRALLLTSWPQAKVKHLRYLEYVDELAVEAELEQDGHRLKLMIDAEDGRILNEEGVKWEVADLPHATTPSGSGGIDQESTEPSDDASETGLSRITGTGSTDRSEDPSDTLTTRTPTPTKEATPTKVPTTKAPTPTPKPTTPSTVKPATPTPSPRPTTKKPATPTPSPKPATPTPKPTKPPATPTPKPTKKPPTPTPQVNIISEAQARQRALHYEEDMKIQSIHLRQYADRIYYEVVGIEWDDGEPEEKYVLEIDAVTGTVIVIAEYEYEDGAWKVED